MSLADSDIAGPASFADGQLGRARLGDSLRRRDWHVSLGLGHGRLGYKVNGRLSDPVEEATRCQ